MARLKELYETKIRSELMERLGCRNVMQVPKVEKIVVNMGVGEGAHDAKALENAMRDLALITGQKPMVTRARKSIAGFKLRKGMTIGCKVTLRRERMYEFLDRLINLALPRIRDFKGVSPRAFDGHGNYTLGVREQIIFPEIDYDKVDRIRGMDITICTTAANDEEARALLSAFGMPFRK